MPRGKRLTLTETGRHFNICDCGYKSRSDTAMKLHMKSVHKGKKVVLNDERDGNNFRICPFCQEVFESFSELREHSIRTRHANAAK